MIGFLAALTFGAGAMACSATVGAETTGSNAQKLAVVDVRVQQGAGSETLRFEAAARFVAVKEPGVPDDALNVLGLAWGAPPVGVCTLGDTLPAAPNAAVRVDLRDLSPVALELAADDGAPLLVRLEPRAFPDVAGVVSGVVFVAPSSTQVAATPRLASLRVGGATLSALELPELPARVQLVDATSVEGTYSIDAHGLDVIISSLAKDGPKDSDRFAIDVVRAGVVRAHCGFDGAGKLRIDALSLGGAGEATLVVRAQRRVLRDDPTLGAVDARLERALELKVVVR